MFSQSIIPLKRSYCALIAGLFLWGGVSALVCNLFIYLLLWPWFALALVAYVPTWFWFTRRPSFLQLPNHINDEFGEGLMLLKTDANNGTNLREAPLKPVFRGSWMMVFDGQPTHPWHRVAVYRDQMSLAEWRRLSSYVAVKTLVASPKRRTLGDGLAKRKAEDKN